jgi:cytochrome c oxidase cbb3-type subunit 3
MKKIILTNTLLFVALIAHAQEAGQTSKKGEVLDFLFNNFIFILSGLVVIGIFFTLMQLVSYMFDLQKMKMMEELGIEAKEKADQSGGKPLLTRINEWAWSIVPIGEESKVDLGHDYDGIRELDNRLPPWWLAIMYGSIVFAFVYYYYYHFSGNEWSSRMEYEIAMEEAEDQKARFLARMANAIDENSVSLLTDEKSLADGLAIYTANCVACHGIYGEGGVGPNFTDKYWIHGGAISNLFKTIKYGVPEKGMISWKSQLRPVDMQKVASYILTFQGTNPPNQKEAQGELWVPEEENKPKVLESSMGK